MVDTPAATGQLSPEYLYQLLATQVQSYHRHYRMGTSTSVSTETAGELLASIQYTLRLSGSSLPQGQELLKARLNQARRELQLVTTLTEQGSQWYWDALASLDGFLHRYDPLHFAHRYPLDIFYPTAVPLPEDLQGIDWVLCFLGCLRREQVLLSRFPTGAVQALFDQAPPDYWAAPENLCQQPLWQAFGRVLLGLSPEDLSLPFAPPRTFTRTDMQLAATEVCRMLAPEADLAAYAQVVLETLFPRLEIALSQNNWAGVFWCN